MKSKPPAAAPTLPDAARRGREIEELYQRFSSAGRRRLRWRRLLWGVSWAAWLELLAGLKRTVDLLAAILLLAAFSPLLLAAGLLARVSGGGLARAPRLGRWACEFALYSFRFGPGTTGRLAARLRLGRLPVLFNILRGDLSLVGPRAVSPQEAGEAELLAWKRYNVRPGLVCLWWIRSRANIAYSSEAEVDLEYMETHSLRGDMGIALRAVPAILFGAGMATAPDRIRVLGIRIDNLTMREALDFLLARVRDPHAPPAQVCFLNADCANIACRDAAYLDVLESASLTLADGIGLKIAGKILARDIRQNVNGTDLFPRLCEALETHGGGLYLLGARPGVAEAVAQWIHTKYPGVRVCGCQHGYFTPAEEPEVVRRVAASGAGVLLVAFGAPRQEKWIQRHLAETGVRVALGVGGLFDFYSGRIPRAPQWMREMGLEWLFRFWQEPGRMWRRYFQGNLLFVFRVVKERLGYPPGPARGESLREA
ncbi:MAG TPA: WecB/TagA/CpsF family glycosyltransferase [Bryobacteraceae bacterium]|nr:WecB/TagA/CpsF family glycosyltransferase [Bryobacteraceae bacterium]